MATLKAARFLRGGAMSLSLVLISAALLAWAGARLWPAAALTSMGRTPAASTEVGIAELRASLAAAGHTPTKLAAAGLNAAATQTLVANARDYLLQHSGAVVEAQASVAAAQTTHDRLERLIQSGQASEGALTAFQTAKSALTSATAARATALGQFIAAAEAGLTEGQRGTLAAIRGNAGQPLPVQYLVTSRTSAEWVALRDAFTSNAVRARSGDEADQGCTQLVNDANAVSATSQAAQALAANGEAVRSAFSAAVGG